MQGDVNNVNNEFLRAIKKYLLLVTVLMLGLWSPEFALAQIKTEISTGGGGSKCTPTGPTISLSATSSSAYAPDTISLVSTISLGETSICTPDSAIQSVSFYANGTLLATVTSAPQNYAWSGVAPGTYSLYAVLQTNVGSVTSNTVSLTVLPMPQTITFGALAAKTYGNAAFTVSASASSGLGVALTTSPSTVCSNSGATISILGAGTCSVTASQSGGGNYAAAAPVTQSFTVAQAAQSINFAALAAKTYGNAAFGVAAAASSGLAVSFASSPATVCTISGPTVTLVGSGTCSITAAQGGNTNYSAAPSITQSFSVYALPTISWSTPAAGSNYPSNATIPLSVNVNGGSFGVTSVSYYDGSTLLGTVSQAPWSYSASGLSVGNHTLNAIVTNANQTTASASLPVTILPLPSISISSPADGATIAASTGFTLTPAISSVYATAGVSYYTSTGTLLCSNTTSSPWSCATAGLPAGSYAVYAVLSTTTANVSATSNPITVTIGTGTGAAISSATPVANPIVAPSVGNPAGGTLPGELGVSASGAATYSIPLGIPPGIAGMVPSLSFNYSSQGSNGMLGLGWSLGGMSQIHRCGKTVAQDGVASGVNFTNTDRLCLDGQRLILMTKGTALPGATGNQIDIDYWSVNATYSTEVANFSRITSYPHGANSLAFKVETKSGRVLFTGVLDQLTAT